jgi:hypothetical protein
MLLNGKLRAKKKFKKELLLVWGVRRANNGI